MVAVSAHTGRVDFRQLTEQCAERVSQTIETCYAREDRYPRDLGQLSPWYLLSVVGPAALFGQDCYYHGAVGYYHLGYVYREHWSDPNLIGRTYKTKGTPADLPPICE